MKRYVAFVLLAVLCSAGWAQPLSFDQQNSGNAVQAPPSGIDLLKQSLQGSSVASSADSAAAVAVSSATVAAPVQARPAASSAKPSAAQAAAPAAPKTTTAKTVSKNASSANVLEMPLATGGVVKTQVPASAAKTSARRTAKPAAKKTAASAKTTQKSASSKTASAKTAAKPAATPTEQDIEKNNALIETASSSAADSEQAAQSAIAQEELDYAARMLRQSKETISSGRFIPPSAAETAQSVPPAKATNKAFNPNDYRPGVEWKPSNTTHFAIYTQKRDNGISSSNMGMIFESAYTTLRRNIPWMMSDKVRVFVYQDHNSYLKHEPNAKAWTRALAYPTRGEIVVYDEPGKQQELKEVFTHELVHIFTQKFFDKYKTDRLMTPTWLDEGLAVYMEDQAYNGMKGGPWANDFKTLNFQRSKETQVANFSSSNMFGGARSFTSGQKGKGAPLYFMPFDQFMEEGSLSVMEGKNKTQDWYFQAYAMVRFLLNPSGGMSPSNRMQFEQFTRLMSQGEQVRDPRTGFPARDKNGKPVYQPYSAEKALSRAYRYNTTANFEDAFWRWADSAR